MEGQLRGKQAKGSAHMGSDVARLNGCRAGACIMCDSVEARR